MFGSVGPFFGDGALQGVGFAGSTMVAATMSLGKGTGEDLPLVVDIPRPDRDQENALFGYFFVRGWLSLSSFFCFPPVTGHGSEELFCRIAAG